MHSAPHRPSRRLPTGGQRAFGGWRAVAEAFESHTVFLEALDFPDTEKISHEHRMTNE